MLRNPDVTTWVDASLREVLANFEDVQIIEQRFRAKPGPASVVAVIAWTIERTRDVLLVRSIDLQNSYLFVRLTATPSAFQAHEECLRRIARSE